MPELPEVDKMGKDSKAALKTKNPDDDHEVSYKLHLNPDAAKGFPTGTTAKPSDQKATHPFQNWTSFFQAAEAGANIQKAVHVKLSPNGIISSGESLLIHLLRLD